MWVLVTLASLLVLLVIILLIPVEAALSLDIHGRPQFRVKMAWFFGLVTREVTGGQPSPPEPERAEEIKRKRRRWRWRPGEILSILRTSGLLRQVFRLVRDIFRLPRLQDLLADLRVGLGDPAETGLLFAVIGPASALLYHRFPNQIRLQPDFTDEAVLDGYVFGKVRLRPIQMAPPILRFTFSTAAIQAAWQMVVNKWKSRR